MDIYIVTVQQKWKNGILVFQDIYKTITKEENLRKNLKKLDLLCFDIQIFWGLLLLIDWHDFIYRPFWRKVDLSYSVTGSQGIFKIVKNELYEFSSSIFILILSLILQIKGILLHGFALSRLWREKVTIIIYRYLVVQYINLFKNKYRISSSFIVMMKIQRLNGVYGTHKT